MNTTALRNVHTNEEIVLEAERATIGRSLDCSVVLKDLSVSRIHCILENVDAQWILRDMSSNGTFVNNIKIHKNEQCILSSNDVIQIGDSSKFSFVLNRPRIGEELLVVSNSVVEDESVIYVPQNKIAADVAVEQLPIVVDIVVKNEKTQDAVDDELTCSICTELFIKAVTLNCSHTFCKYCIGIWKRSNSICPICRKKFTSEFPTLVVDNFINKFLETASEEVRRKRQELVEEREKAITKARKRMITVPVDLSSSSSDDEEDDDDDDDQYDDMDFSDHSTWEEDFSDWSMEYNGLPGVFYGGYGRCFTCGQSGHWSNGCPS